MGVIGAQDQEWDVFVDKIVVTPSAARLPGLCLDGVPRVVVTGNVKKGHLQLMHIPLEFLPLLRQNRRLLGVTLDEIADGHDKGGLEQIELLDCLRKN